MLEWEKLCFPLQLKPISITQLNARRLVREGLKNELMYGGGERANGYAARHSPPKWEGRLAI